MQKQKMLVKLCKNSYQVALVITASSLQELVKPIPYYGYVLVDIGVDVIRVHKLK